MIFDNIKNCEMYYGANPKFKRAFEFIKKAMDENLEVGKYEIDGKDIHAIIQSYDSKLPEKARFEGHENYIDIQCVVKGREQMGVIEIANAVISDAYNPEKDVAFYQDNENASYCIAKDGDFCIFYPHDIHRPGLCVDNKQTPIFKVIVKVHV